MISQYQPSLEQVKKLAPKGNLIPIYRELPADLETPVSVYLKLQGKIGGPSFLLESVEKGEQVGRYSFIGVDPPMTMAAWGGAGDNWGSRWDYARKTGGRSIFNFTRTVGELATSGNSRTSIFYGWCCRLLRL